MNEIHEYYNLKRKILMNLVAGGTTLINVIVFSSFMKFYTDMVGLNPAIYGVVFLIFSIWNGINDPMLGYWADKRPFLAGRGKYLPLIRWSIPVVGFSVIAVLLASPGWNEIIIAAYLLIFLMIYEGAQTLLGVSFMAFTVNTFISMEERTQVQVIATYINMLPTFLGGMIPIWFLTGEYSRTDLIAVFSIAVILGMVLLWIGSRFIRENEAFYKNIQATRNLKELLVLSKDLFRDKTFAIFMASFFLISAATGNYFSGYIYYMDNVLEVSGLKATLPDVINGLAQMAIFPFIVIMVRKYGSRDTLWRGLLLAVVGHAILTLPINYWVTVVTYVVIMLGYGFASAINNPMGGLVVDHIELKTGKRQPGVVRGVMAVLMAPAGSIQPLILSTLLSASGYIGTSKSQSAEVVQAIRIGTGLIPAIILLAGIVLLIFLPINHRRELEIQADIETKHGRSPGKADAGGLEVYQPAD